MLFRTYLSNSFSIFVKVLAGIALLRICTDYLGKDGLGLASQFQGLVLLVYAFFNALLFNHIAQTNWKKKSKSMFSRLLGIAFICSIISAFLLAIFAQQISMKFFGDNKAQEGIYVLSFSSPFIALFVAYSAKLCADGRLILFNLVNAIAILISTVIIYLLIIHYGQNGAYLGLGFYYVFPMLMLGILIFKSKQGLTGSLPTFKGISHYPKNKFINLAIVGIFSAFNAIALQIFLRHQLANIAGWSSVGDWQVISKISDSYMLLVTTPLTTYLLPKLSKINKVESQNKLINRVLLYGSFITSITGSIIYFLWDPIVIKIIGATFSFLHPLTIIQFTGDVFKIISWTLIIVALARMQLKFAILAELIYSILYVVLVLCLTPLYRLEGAVLSYLFSNMITAFMLIIFYKIFNRNLRLNFNSEH